MTKNILVISGWFTKLFTSSIIYATVELTMIIFDEYNMFKLEMAIANVRQEPFSLHFKNETLNLMYKQNMNFKLYFNNLQINISNFIRIIFFTLFNKWKTLSQD